MVNLEKFPSIVINSVNCLFDSLKKKSAVHRQIYFLDSAKHHVKGTNTKFVFLTLQGVLEFGDHQERDFNRNMLCR